MRKASAFLRQPSMRVQSVCESSQQSSLRSWSLTTAGATGSCQDERKTVCGQRSSDTATGEAGYQNRREGDKKRCKCSLYPHPSRNRQPSTARMYRTTQTRRLAPYLPMWTKTAAVPAVPWDMGHEGARANQKHGGCSAG